MPDDQTKTDMQRAGKAKIVGTWKLCLDDAGNVSRVTKLKGTGFAAYDTLITNVIRGTWRYRPVFIDGRPTPVCTAVTIIYSQK
jgi:hypothetical protein